MATARRRFQQINVDDTEHSILSVEAGFQRMSIAIQENLMASDCRVGLGRCRPSSDLTKGSTNANHASHEI